MKGIWKKSANIFVCGLLGAAILVAGCGDSKTSAAVKEKPAVKTEQQLSAARNTPIVAAAKKVGPAVVGITNKAYVRDFFNRVQLTERGTGSGVIYDKAGYIATNNHVVEGASEIIVSLPDGRTVKGKVLGADAVTDLAVVKINLDNLPVAEFGDSDTLQVGEPAIAIGNPLGMEFRGSVTAGVISALNRSIEIGERKFNLIQTDAAINPGNSGGALLNAQGEVIGINEAKYASAQVEGVGYAIPISNVKSIIDDLKTRTTKVEVAEAEQGYLGIQIQNIDSSMAQLYGMPEGVYVYKITEDSAASESDLHEKDIITKLDGETVRTNADLSNLLTYYKAGTTVTLTVQSLQDGAYVERQVQVTLKNRPQEVEKQ